MLLNRLALLFVPLSLSAFIGQAQVAPTPQTPTPLTPEQPIERQISGGESHTYRITLTAGQFIRVVVDQKGIDLALALAAPQGEADKSAAEANLTRVDMESLSYEATVSGDYRLTIRALGATTLSGTYQADLQQKAAATAKDKQRITAERLLGEAYPLYQRGQAQPATEKFEQALVLWREVGDQYWESYTLTYLGNAGLNLSSIEKAIGYFEQARVLSRDLKDRGSEGNALNGLGTAFRLLGQAEKAIEYLKESVAIRRETKNRYGEGSSLGNLGLAYKDLSQHEKAIECYEQALQISREVKDRSLEGRSLNGLGMASRELSRYEKALEHYEQALLIGREVKDRPGEGIRLTSLGRVHYALGRSEKAIEYYEQGLATSREVKDLVGEESSLHQLAEAERNRGNLVRARTLIEDRLRIAESTRSNLVSTESRSSLLSSVQSSYQLYTDILMLQHRAAPTQGFDALAVEVSERQRARSLLDLLTEAHADVRQGVDAALIERERSLGKQLNDKAQLLTQAKPEQTVALKKEISQLENDYERAQAAIRKASPHYAALTQPQPLKLKEIQAQLDADTLLLEYALGAEHSYLWAITKDSLTSFELPKADLIQKSALQVTELLTARSTNKRGESAQQRQQRITQAEASLTDTAQALSQTLLAPVAGQLGNKRLVIVADGALQYIPFAMLPEPSVVSRQLSMAKNNGLRTTDNGQPLIVRHEVVSLPSASALAIQRSELAGRKPAPKLLAVFADPVFDRSDVRLVSAGPGVEKSPVKTSFNDARSIEHLAGGAGDKSGVNTLRMVIPRLPYTRQEAEQILALTPKSDNFRAIDFAANKTSVLDPSLSQYRYLHFATHGLLDTEQPGLSSLVLSMMDEHGQPRDGFLRANDIYNLKLPAELVVLSACQTGLGKDIKGEGLVGLTRGFMYAGAARVVVSLWNVNDQATADLMTKFYEKMLKHGDRPAAALRAAQVEMWKQKQWQSPYYWAAFTMQGEWR